MRDLVVTRVEQSGPPMRSRNLEERLMVRFPGAYQAIAALGWRLFSPRSRLRRVVLRRQAISAYAAANRRDYELMLVRYARDVEVEFEAGFEPLGLDRTHRGHDGFLRFLETWGEAWEDWEVTPAAVVDLAERIVFLGHNHLPATASGVPLGSEFAQLITLRRGLVAHEREFLSWEKALRAAGLDPNALALHSGSKSAPIR